MLLGTAGLRAENSLDRMAELESRVEQLEGTAQGGIPEGLSLGGYGELHYNRLRGEGGASDVDRLDFHRFVLFVGYEFSPRIRLNSELELEHTLVGDDKPGYLQLEQAYLDFDLSDRHLVRAGIFILPVGFLNRNHEPTRFYGVERNRVENRILPTTWFEGGVGLAGSPTPGWCYEAYLHSGLKTSADSSYAIRAGRQKIAEADASRPAATAAVAWSIPGLRIGASLHHQSDLTQGTDPDAGEAWLGEAHLEWRRGPFALRALVAEWRLDGVGPEALGADRQYGWFMEVAYRPIEKMGVFARYSTWDEQAGASDIASEAIQWDAGVNWWVHKQVVVKADAQWQDPKNGKKQNGYNLGLGYEF